MKSFDEILDICESVKQQSKLPADVIKFEFIFPFK